MKTRYVRIFQKSPATGFFRCGMKFTRDWCKLENIDDATARRLEEEQMLEVSKTPPAGLENQAPNETDPSRDAIAVTGSGTAASAPTTGDTAAKLIEVLGGQTAPEDTAVRLEAIRAAVGQMDKENAALWTAGGKPKTEAVAAITGWPVTAAERDAALAVAE